MFDGWVAAPASPPRGCRVPDRHVGPVGPAGRRASGRPLSRSPSGRRRSAGQVDYCVSTIQRSVSFDCDVNIPSMAFGCGLSGRFFPPERESADSIVLVVRDADGERVIFPVRPGRRRSTRSYTRSCPERARRWPGRSSAARRCRSRCAPGRRGRSATSGCSPGRTRHLPSPACRPSTRPRRPTPRRLRRGPA